MPTDAYIVRLLVHMCNSLDVMMIGRSFFTPRGHHEMTRIRHDEQLTVFLLSINELNYCYPTNFTVQQQIENRLGVFCHLLCIKSMDTGENSLKVKPQGRLLHLQSTHTHTPLSECPI